MGITFQQPLWLLLILACVPITWIALRWFQTMSRLRAWTGAIARSILIALIACMLAGASAVQTSDKLAVIAVVDVSDSVKQFASFDRPAQDTTLSYPTAVREWLQQVSADRSEDDLFGMVVFDGDSIAVAAPSSRDYTDYTLDYSIAQGTNIEDALRYAEALFPPGAARRLVLISDGVETSGNALRAASELAASGADARTSTRIDVLPITYEVRNEVMVESVDAPPNAPEEATVPVRIVLRATDETRGRIEMRYEGQLLDLNGGFPGTGRPVTLKPGRNFFVFDIPLREARRVHRFEPVFIAEDDAADRIASNNRAETFTITPSEGRVLIIDGAFEADGPASRALHETLDRAGIPVRSVVPSEAPDDLLALQDNDLIILQNVPAEELPIRTHQLLVDYVTDLGGGLIMVGGYDSFGPGGWKGTPIEPVLPVRLDLPEQLVMPSAAVMFVIDSSGSMRQSVLGGSKSQQEIANEATARAVQTLDPTDLVGVLAFNSGYSTIVPLRRNADPDASAARILSITSGGGTNLYPALAAAGQKLQEVDASIKHIIVLSDGQSEGDPMSGIGIAQNLFQQYGITTTTIAVGDAADVETLGNIAEVGAGQFYRVYDPGTLPRIFVKEIRVVRRPLIREVPFTPQILPTGSPIVRGLPTPIPRLRGLVLTRPREDPKITYAMSTERGEPLLAHWFVGRGQVAAWTSDAHNWARFWLDWPGYSTFWVQAARLLARAGESRDYELTTQVVGDELKIRLDAADDQGRPLDLLSVPGAVYSPDGERRDIRLEQTGPGVYTASAPARDQGNYIVTLTPRQGEIQLAPVVGGTSRAIGPEFSRLRSDVSLLREIAQMTDGRLLQLDFPEAADLFSREGLEPTRAALPLWPTLLAWSIVVFLLDVGTRRIAWDRFISRELVDEVRARAVSTTRQRSEAAAATLAGLRTRSEEAEQPATPAAQARQRPRPAPKRAARKTEPEVSSEDAERDRRQEEERAKRQKELRQQMLHRLANEPQPKPRPEKPSNTRKKQPKPEDEPATTQGLLAAKRRARERFQGEDESS